MDYDELKQNLEVSGANIRCNDLKRWLTDAGFNVVAKSNGNHYIFTHDGLEGFTSGSFDCGHKRNAQILKLYIRKILKIIVNHEDGLREILG